MKILALSYLFPNPALPHYGIFVFNRLMAIQRNCELKVISPIQWYPLIDKLTPWTNGNARIPYRALLGGIEVYYPRFFVIPKFMKWLDAFSFLAAVRPIAKALWRQGFRFDIIDVHWTYPDILAGYVLSRLYGKPFIVTIRGHEALYLGERGGRKRILDWLLKKAAAVITLSSELGRLCREIGVASEQLKVILNGIDKDIFQMVEQKKARVKLGLGMDKKIIISVGSLIERKGHHEIIATLPKLQQQFDVELYILGGENPEGDFSQKIRAKIASLGLKNVHLIGRVEHAQLADWYNAANLFCLATKGEGCPNVVMEALACGTPVVVTNVGAVPDLVIADENGFIVNELSKLGELIAKALETPWDRGAISKKARGRTWANCASEVIAVYDKVIKLQQLQ